MDFSFMFDGYVNGSYNHPDSGFNQLRNFDFRADTLHVNMGKITIDRAPAPVGFHLDVGFGQTFSVIAAVLVGDSLLPFRRARHRADREIHRRRPGGAGME
jgi:hypothetical protein